MNLTVQLSFSPRKIAVRELVPTVSNAQEEDYIQEIIASSFAKDARRSHQALAIANTILSQMDELV